MHMLTTIIQQPTYNQNPQSLLFARALASLGFQPHGVINILGFNAVCRCFAAGLYIYVYMYMYVYIYIRPCVYVCTSIICN